MHISFVLNQLLVVISSFTNLLLLLLLQDGRHLQTVWRSSLHSRVIVSDVTCAALRCSVRMLVSKSYIERLSLLSAWSVM